MKIKHTGKNVVKMSNGLSVVVELEAYKKMQCYIDICDKEVGWLGTAYKEGNEIRVTDVFLFDQEVHATTCELTPGGIADFVTNLYNIMDADEAMEISNNLTCWGHSHVRMGVSPSGQDDIQLRSFSSSGHEWFLRVIGNKFGEYEYTYIDYTLGIEIKDLDWRINIPGLDISDIKEDIKTEVKQKVREKVITRVTPTPYYNNNYYRSSAFYPSDNSGKTYISTSDGIKPVTKTRNRYDYGGYNYYEDSLLDEDYFDRYLKSQKEEAINNVASEEEDNILANMGASCNHDLIMDILGNNTDLASDAEYQILDEALCQLTLDDLAYLSTCSVDVALKYMKDNTADYFTDAEIDELHDICIYYKENLMKLNS